MLELNRSVSLSQLQQRVLLFEQKFQERLETPSARTCWDVPDCVEQVREDCAELLRRVDGLDERLRSSGGGPDAEIVRKRFPRLEKQVLAQELATASHEALLKRQSSKLYSYGKAADEFAARLAAMEGCLQSAVCNAKAAIRKPGADEEPPSTCASNTAALDSSLEASPSLSMRVNGQSGEDGASVASSASLESPESRGVGRRAPSSADLCSDEEGDAANARITVPAPARCDDDARARCSELHVRVDGQERALAELTAQLHAAIAEAEASLGKRPQGFAVGASAGAEGLFSSRGCDVGALSERRDPELEKVSATVEDLISDVSELYSRLRSGEEENRTFQAVISEVLEGQLRRFSKALAEAGSSVGECAKRMDAGGPAAESVAEGDATT